MYNVLFVLLAEGAGAHRQKKKTQEYQSGKNKEGDGYKVQNRGTT